MFDSHKSQADTGRLADFMLMFILVCVVAVVAILVLTSLQDATVATDTYSTFQDNRVLFTSGQSTLSNGYCTTVSSMTPYESSWPLP